MFNNLSIRIRFRILYLLLFILFIPGIYISLVIPEFAFILLFLTFFLLLALVTVLYTWIVRPYRLLLDALSTANPESIRALSDRHDEFGQIASPMLRFLEQKNELSGIIQEKNEILAALTEAEAKNRAIFTAIPESLFRVDLFGVISDIHIQNPEDVPVLSANLVGQSLEEILPASARADLDQSISEVNRTKIPRSFDFRWELHNQKSRYYEITVAPSGHGGYLIILRNITDRKEVEIAMNRMLETEQELNKLKTRFFTNISHAFRTPLSVILSNTQLIEQHHDSLSKDQKETSLERIYSSIAKITRLLDDVKMFANDRDSSPVYQPEELDLVYFCSNLVNDIERLENMPGRIRLVIRCSSPHMHTDRTLLYRILSNLLNNAIKFSNTEHEVLLTISDSDTESMLFEVTDSGIGIPANEQKSIFEPFHRCSNAGDIPGSGLGLTMVRRCLELLNGTILIESKVNRGTTVRVTLKDRTQKPEGT